MRADAPVILASASPRRRELLSQFGIPFRVIASDAPESIDANLDPTSQALALAERKAWAVAEKLDRGLVLGADTIVVADGVILGKPADDADARHMLRPLSDREHQVVTGIAVVDAATGSLLCGAVTSVVEMRHLSDAEIAAYVATGEPRDKAGAYAIQGAGGNLIARLTGCFTNVVGLPLCETARLLTTAGVVLPKAWRGCRLPDGACCPREV